MGAIRRFMDGRYGTDHLSLFLTVLYLILYVVGSLAGLSLLSVLAFMILFYSLTRSLSRKIDRRRAENAWFLGLLTPFVRWYQTRRAIRRDHDHCYFKCPGCGQRLRVPKGKGKINVTCRACGACFEEKS